METPPTARDLHIRPPSIPLAFLRSIQRQMNCVHCPCNTLRENRENCLTHKCALLAIFILILCLSLPITALIISTGKFWKCPGEPQIFAWSLGFGVMGVLFCWYWIVMIIQRLICDDVSQREFRYTSYTLITCIFLGFALAWTMVGIFWLHIYSLRSNHYYINGKNMYCDPLISKFVDVMRWLLLLYFILPVAIACCSRGSFSNRR